ncbi:hypothetical protein HQ560_08715 [bacterium]|nr:hypothetical protein [bacterium]
MRLYALLLALVTSLSVPPDAALAASRRNTGRNNNGPIRPGERRGIINDNTKNEREKEKKEQKKKEEEKRRADDKRKKDEAKRAADEKKKQIAEKKKQAIADAKKAVAEKRKANAQKAAERKAGGKKGGEGPAKDPSFKEAEAEKMVAAAEEAFSSGKVSDVLKGVELLRTVTSEFGGTSVGPVAAERLEQLLSHQAIGPVVFAAEADQYFGAARYRQALNKYNELLARFPTSEQGAAAGERIAEIRDGDLLSKTVYTEGEIEDARLWYLAGSIHLENGRETEAASAWRRVIENYPGCPYAQRAETRLRGEPRT